MTFAHDIIIAPVVTERSMDMMADRKYTFKVAKGANKIQIAKAIEEIKPECTATEQQRIDNQLAYWYKTVAEHLS